MRTFIKNLQRKEESIRRRWLYLGTTIVALVVVILWVGYLNFKLEPIKAAEPAKQSSSFLDTFGLGLKEVGVQIETGLANTFFYFDELLRRPRVLEIRRHQ